MVKTKIRGKLGQPSFRGDVNQCPTCFTLFNSTYAFDKHRIGTHSPNTRRCMSEDEMLKAGMGKNRYNRWVSNPMSPEGVGDMKTRFAIKKLLRKSN